MYMCVREMADERGRERTKGTGGGRDQDGMWQPWGGEEEEERAIEKGIFSVMLFIMH